jgi:hypothetical protein
MKEQGIQSQKNQIWMLATFTFSYVILEKMLSFSEPYLTLL